jgi:CyaY protein
LGQAADTHGFDVDLNGGALSVEFEDTRERFVVSPNAPVRQIWVSAHVQSFKLDWDDAHQAFVLAATGQTLEQVLEAAVAVRVAGFHL